MPNGTEKREGQSNGRRASDYNRDWCDERHNTIEAKLSEIWGEEHGGIKAIWNKMDGVNKKLWSIIIGQVAILGGIVVTLLRDVIGG